MAGNDHTQSDCGDKGCGTRVALGRKDEIEKCKGVNEKTICFSVEESRTKSITERDDLQHRFQMKCTEW